MGAYFFFYGLFLNFWRKPINFEVQSPPLSLLFQVFFCFTYLPAILVLSFASAQTKITLNLHLLFVFLSYLIVVFITLLQLPQNLKNDLFKLPLAKKSSIQKSTLLCIATYPFILLINSSLNLIFSHLFGIEPQEQMIVSELSKIADQPFTLLLMAFLACFAAPFIEELVFRALLQNYILKKLNHNRQAIGLSSAIFAIYHVNFAAGWANISLIISIFCLSLLLGLVYIKTKTIWSSIALHSVYNSLSFILVMMGAY